MEEYGSVYAKDDRGSVICELVTPSVMVYWLNKGKGGASENISIHAWGNQEDTLKRWNDMKSRVDTAGVPELMNDYYLLDIPLDVDTIQRVLDTPNVLKSMLKANE